MKTTLQKISLTVISLVLVVLSPAQNANQNHIPEHKIIFQLTSGDTSSHKQLMKQFTNILSVSPTTQIEVVCHGPGLDMLVSDKSVVQDKLKALSVKGVLFMACEFSIKERKVDRTKILPSAGFVPAGIIEIVNKQEQGWSYIKAGN